MSYLTSFLKTKGSDLGWNVIMALIILVLGYFAIKILIKVVGKVLSRTKLDGTIVSFIKSVIKVCGYILLGIMVASILHIPTAPLITAFGAVGLAVSFAVKDSLANMASGLIILITKEFALNDYISVDGIEGTVKKISLVHTMLNTLDNKRIYIPNGQIAATKLINYSAEEKRRLDLVFSIGYEDDMDKAKQILRRIVDNHPYALKEPEPMIRVCSHGASSVDIAVRVWVVCEKYWDLNFDLYEMVKKEFDKENIHIPYNQLDVHVKKEA